MTEVSALSRSWTDGLSAFSIGALATGAFSAPLKIDGSRIGLDINRVLEFRSYLNDLGAAEATFAILILSGIFLAIGNIIIQFGELLSIIADMFADSERPRQRANAVVENPILIEIFRSSYRSFRLLCGLGALCFLFAVKIAIVAATGLDWQACAFGLAIMLFGFFLAGRFARYSFTHLDWLIFGDIHE
ncbi:hypothetical protein [Salipiger abyssi]|uniref:hypothetical protein n=1 Tax=Salipiger abyssi TaxID=1250539 RepID=UPI0040585883